MKLIGFSYPAALILLLGIIPLWLWHANSQADLPPLRKKYVLCIRLIIYTLVVLALAGLRLYLPTDRMCITFLVDDSLSAPDEHMQFAMDFIQKSIKQARYDDRINVVLFGNDVYLDQTLQARNRLENPSTTIQKDRTNIAQAINFGQAISSPDSIKRLVLISDGNENMGSAREESIIACARDTQILTVPYPDQKRSEVMIKDIHVPEKVNIDEPFDLKVTVESNVSTEVTMKIFSNGVPMAQDKVTVHQGENIFYIPQKSDKAGTSSYEAFIEAPEDQILKNNRATAIVFIKGKPRVLYLTDWGVNPGPVATFINDAGIEVHCGNPGNLPGNLADMKNYDSIVFSNLSALSISPRQMDLIKSFVQDLGGGFTMIGGMNSFGIGGYFGTPVEEILPVEMDVRKKKRLPQTALILVIDKSGSMEDIEGGKKQKVVLAREAAIITMEIMNKDDVVGVIAFDSAAKWVVTPQHPENMKSLIREVSTIRAGGGTNLYPPLEAAISELTKTNAALKHIIVLSDGRTEPGNFDALGELARKSGITISCVAVGKDSDIPFMESLARNGKGRAYFVSDATLLPRIFVKDTFIAAQSAVMEEPFIPKISEYPGALAGIPLEKAPQLNGYCITAEKSLATLSLVSHKKDPILALWRSGLGKSVAFTSDEGEKWAGEWYKWSECAPFWQQLIRWTLPSIEQGDYEISTEIKDDTCTIYLDAVDNKGDYINFLQFNGKVISPGLESLDVPLHQVGPGRYSGDFTIRSEGNYLINVRERGGASHLFAITVPFSPEYNSSRANINLLNKVAELSGGKFNPSPGDVFMHSSKKAYTPRDTWEKLLLLAILLFPFDIALRRVFLPAGWHNRFIRRMPAPAPPREENLPISTLSALKSKKHEVATRYTKLSETDAELVRTGTLPDQREKPVAADQEPKRPPAIPQEQHITTPSQVFSKPEVKPTLSTDSISYLERLKQAKRRAKNED